MKEPGLTALARTALILGFFLPVPRLIWAQESARPQRQVVIDGPIELSVQLSSPSVLIAQPIILRLQVDAPRNTQVTLPTISDTLGGFSVIDTNVVEDLPLDSTANTHRWVSSIELESVETGEQTIPPLEVVYRLPESFASGLRAREGALKSQSISVQIISALNEQEDPSQFRDIKGIHEFAPASAQRSRLPWLTLGLAGAAFAIIGWVLWSRRQRPPAAKLWAFAEVDRIETQCQSNSISIAQAYTQLSIMIRIYLEAQLGIPATALGSGELMSELQPNACSATAKQQLKQFMIEADQAQYSGAVNVDRSQDRSPFDSIRAIIQQTSEAAQPPNPQERS